MNIVEAAHQYHAAMHVADASRENLINTMRICNRNGMSIVELAKISGFSRPTVMKYVQTATTATVEA
jgi:predicted transcriptional regulator